MVKVTNKACVIATAMAAAFGVIKLKPSSFSLNPERSTLVSSILQAKNHYPVPVAAGVAKNSNKVYRAGNRTSRATAGAEESLRIIVYLSCWGPN